jgi:hypothetical protein
MTTATQSELWERVEKIHPLGGTSDAKGGSAIDSHESKKMISGEER